MHEPSISVPFQVRYPKRIPAGTVREEMVLDTDIAPTLLDLAGVPIPAHMLGKSILPFAKNTDPDFRKEWCYEYYDSLNPEKVAPHRGIRTEQHKLIQYELDPSSSIQYRPRASYNDRLGDSDREFSSASIGRRASDQKSAAPQARLSSTIPNSNLSMPVHLPAQIFGSGLVDWRSGR